MIFDTLAIGKNPNLHNYIFLYLHLLCFFHVQSSLRHYRSMECGSAIRWI